MKEVNKENEFERLLKEKTDRFEMKPAPEVWQRVQDSLQKDRRRRFAWWLMAALLFAVLGTGAFFMLERKSNQSTTPPTAENNPDRSGTAVNSAPAEKNNTGKNPSSESINDNTSKAQNQSVDIYASKNQQEKNLKNKNESHSVLLDRGTESAENGQMLNQVQHDVNADSEFIALLSWKQLPFSLQEVSIHVLPIQKSSLDFSSPPASKHSFYFEADAMALKSFVWNHASSSPGPGSSATMQPAYNSAHSFMKGYSAGGNFLLEQHNKWIFGMGAHLSKTHVEAIIAQQTFQQYDSVGTVNDTSGQLVYTFDTVLVTTTQSQHDINQWLEISLMTGVKLFPDSKNHLRILAGIGYSRLLANKISTLQTSDAPFDTNFSAGANPNNVASNPFPTYQKNQLHLFSEIAYQRDLTSRLSFSAGMQLHYYPLNLLTSNELSQHMMWVGLKGGLLFRL
jgi:hypothetical protein